MWGGTGQGRPIGATLDISIHPPRVGRDLAEIDQFRKETNISIHPPRVGRDRVDIFFRATALLFQSTLPVWGGTGDGSIAQVCREISIHPPRVGRDVNQHI